MQRKQHARLIRSLRTVHRTMGAFLFVIFLVVSVSGLLLGWKKHSGGMILPESHVGTSTDLRDWRPINELRDIAFQTLHQQVDPSLSTQLQRIDARPDKGMVKFVFDYHYWGIQLDGATGDVLNVQYRRHDVVENIHDGSILDVVLKTDSEYIKLAYTSIVGVALFTFTATGFWLWLGPKVMRRKSVQAIPSQPGKPAG